MLYKAGVTLENIDIYVGSLTHTDDVCSLTCNPSSSEKQAKVIKEFMAF